MAKSDKTAEEAAGGALENAEAAAEQEKAMSDYDRHLGRVKVVAEMTDTEGWGAFYAHARWGQRQSLEALKDAEKPREVVQHQQAIKAVEMLMTAVARPCRELSSFIESMPLFASGMKTRAEFDQKTGRVILRTIS